MWAFRLRFDTTGGDFQLTPVGYALVPGRLDPNACKWGDECGVESGSENNDRQEESPFYRNLFPLYNMVLCLLFPLYVSH